MTVGHRVQRRWGPVALGYGLHALGLVLDGTYHVMEPHAESAPLWAHLPIYAGAVVLLVAVVGMARRDPDDGWLRVALVGAVVEVVALAWSVSVQAEANDFYLPGALGFVGGVTTFVALAHTWRHDRRTRV